MLFTHQADATIVNVALSSIRAELGASGAQSELVISGYLLASVTLLLTGARLDRLLGYRTVFLTGVAVYRLRLTRMRSGGRSGRLGWCSGRPRDRWCVAFPHPQVLTRIQAYSADGAERTRALDSYSIALARGAVIGQFLGGVLVSADVHGSGCRPIFLINVPITLGVFVLVFAGCHTAPQCATTGIPGAMTLASAVLLIVLPLTVGRDAGWLMALTQSPQTCQSNFPG